MMETVYSSNAGNKQLLVERSFDAPVNTVWDAWTNPALLEQWWAPRPFKAITHQMDLKEGGCWLYYMLGTDGSKFWCRVDFVTINQPQRMVSVSNFCDEHGVITGELPQIHWDIMFHATGDTTRVNVVLSFDSEADMEKIISMGMKEGFAMAHTNLDALLKQG